MTAPSAPCFSLLSSSQLRGGFGRPGFPPFCERLTGRLYVTS